MQNKKTPEHSATRRTVATTEYVPLRTIAVTDSDNTKLRTIKQERTTNYLPRPVKPEPGIHMRHRVNPRDKERAWKFVHVSGRPCNQGGDRDCNSQSENEENTNDLNNDTLPDLPRVSDPMLASKSSNGGNIPDETIPTLVQNERNTVDLTSPPAVQRRDFIPQISKSKVATNLGDLLCTLNFDVQIEQDTLPSDDHTRKVTTIPAENSLEKQETVADTQQSPSLRHDVIPTNSARTVVTTILLDDDTIITTNTPKTPLGTRQVVTLASSDSSSRPNSMINDGLNALFAEDDSNQTRASANLNSTPRSVITDPDAVELETANMLLQLGSLSNSGSKHHYQLEAAYDNSSLLPVDAAPLKDFARDFARNEIVPDKNNHTEQVNDETVESTDSDKTVDYTPKASPEEKVTSPKGSLKYKQYGIKRPSPKTGPNRNHLCPYCDVICHSKREWNTHQQNRAYKGSMPGFQKNCFRLLML